MRSIIVISLLPLLSQCTPHAPSSSTERIHRREAELYRENAVVAASITASSSADPSASSAIASEETALSANETNNFFVLDGITEPVVALSNPQEQATLSQSTRTTPLVMGYYPDWVSASFPPEKIDFKRFDWVDFAFALPDEGFNLVWDDPKASPGILRRLVANAHAFGKKVKVSVGGATGSKFFTPAVSTPENRATFARSMLQLYTDFSIDGIDIDWEYPGQTSGGSENFNPDDTANLLAFIQLLRITLPSAARITAATQTSPFVDAKGVPLKDMSEFAKVLDFVTIMNYDANGSSSEPGANAPLNNGCQKSEQPTENAVSAYEQWTAAGFPASQLVLGVPSYGYISKSSASTLQARRIQSRHFSIKSRDASNVVVVNDDGKDDGQVQFRALIAQGALVQGTDAQYVGGGEFVREWHPCSSTPWLHSSSSGQIITYDDPESLLMKAKFAREVGMLGVNMWDVHGDTDDWALTDAVRRGLFGAQ